MKNMKISAKLITSFAIMIAMALIVGILGIFGMNSINNADDKLYNENLLAVEYMGEIRECLQRQRTIIRNFALYAHDEVNLKAQKTSLEGYEKNMDEFFNKYEATITDPALETAYYKSKDVYEKEYKNVKEAVYAASFNSTEEAFAVIADANTTRINEDMVSGFTTAMDNNSSWAKDAVSANTTLFWTMAIISGIVLLAAVGVSVFLAFYISGLISKPIAVLTSFMNKAGSSGDITLSQQDIETIARFSQNRDETGLLIASTQKFIKHITIIAEELGSVAEGDLTVHVEVLSQNDVMGAAMKKVVDNLNNMFGEINSSTAQVSSGSKQIADGAQSLAQGSTEQAAAVEQLSSSITEIAVKTKDNAEMADRAARLASTIKDSAEKGNRQMNEMMNAVKEINEASQSINKVISVIDSIAFQTNILALNAAVEAARAGQHGKGFAVVAEEVRSLAAKSADAAKDTGGLIANSMEKAELGARIADETAASLVEIVSGINESNKLVNDIARSSEEQSSGIEQINKGINQVAQVIQQNSATAEESAAASEEMSGQANMLEDLISQFKLKNSGSSSRMYMPASKPQHKQLSMPKKPELFMSENDADFGKY